MMHWLLSCTEKGKSGKNAHNELHLVFFVEVKDTATLGPWNFLTMPFECFYFVWPSKDLPALLLLLLLLLLQIVDSCGPIRM